MMGRCKDPGGARAGRRRIVALAALTLCSCAAEYTEHPVIPTEQESVLTEIFGGAPLPAGCEFAGGHIATPSMTMEYLCPAGKVVVQVGHPRDAPFGAVVTDRFAIVIREGRPPWGFLAAIESHVRSREAAFQWRMVRSRQPSGANPPATTTDLQWKWLGRSPAAQAPLSNLDVLLLAAVIVLPTATAIVGLALLARTFVRSSRQTTSPP